MLTKVIYIGKHEPQAREAWNTLLKAGLLLSSKQREHMAPQICNTPNIEVARRMYERRRAGYLMRGWGGPPPSEVELRRAGLKAVDG